MSETLTKAEIDSFRAETECELADLRNPILRLDADRRERAYDQAVSKLKICDAAERGLEAEALLAAQAPVIEKVRIAKEAYDRLIAEEGRVFGGPVDHRGRAGLEMNAFRNRSEELFSAYTLRPKESHGCH